MSYVIGATSQSVDVLIVDDSGLPVTGLVAGTFPALVYSRAGANANVAFPALTNLATITTAWAAGGVKERSGGRYRLDVPDAIFAVSGLVQIIGEETDKRVIALPIDVAVSPYSVSLAPVVGRVGSTGSVADSDTVVAYHHAPVEAGPFIILDSDNNPIDMSVYSGSLAFVVYSGGEDGSDEVINARLTGANVIVGGDDNNEISLTGTTALTTLVGRFRFAIRVTTTNNKLVRCQGPFIVKACGNTA